MRELETEKVDSIDVIKDSHDENQVLNTTKSGQYPLNIDNQMISLQNNLQIQNKKLELNSERDHNYFNNKSRKVSPINKGDGFINIFNKNYENVCKNPDTDKTDTDKIECTSKTQLFSDHDIKENRISIREMTSKDPKNSSINDTFGLLNTNNGLTSHDAKKSLTNYNTDYNQETTNNQYRTENIEESSERNQPLRYASGSQMPDLIIGENFEIIIKNRLNPTSDSNVILKSNSSINNVLTDHKSYSTQNIIIEEPTKNTDSINTLEYNNAAKQFMNLESKNYQSHNNFSLNSKVLNYDTRQFNFPLKFINYENIKTEGERDDFFKQRNIEKSKDKSYIKKIPQLNT